MAKMDGMKMSAGKALRDKMYFHVRVVGVKRLKVRVFLCEWVIRFGIWLTGLSCVIELKDKPDGEDAEGA